MAAWHVRPSIEADWAAYRALRLEMLADTPIAFTETLERARLHPDRHWRDRAANRNAHSRLFAAVAGDGSWLGTMGGFHPPANADPVLVGVYITPALRGSQVGLADALLDTVIEWSRDRGERLLLDVHESNLPALRFYRRRGFAMTGVTRPYVIDPRSVDLEMALTIARR